MNSAVSDNSTICKEKVTLLAQPIIKKDIHETELSLYKETLMVMNSLSFFFF